MLAARQLLGEKGERIAESWLAGRGWILIERRFRSGHRDIDLVVERSDEESGSRVVAFVEVKTRSTEAFGGPAGSVNLRKQRRCVMAARDFLARYSGPERAVRFDVVAVLDAPAGPSLTHIPDAFPAEP